VTRLKSLSREGEPIITAEFVQGEKQLTEEDLAPYLKETDVEVDLQPLRDVVDEVMDNYEAGDWAMEAELAPAFHRLMPLTRRQAADLGIWQYLAIVHFEDLVRHRWQGAGALREKFVGEGPTNIYSHALNRLWWIAELTYDLQSGGYGFTREVFSYDAAQALVNQIFDRWFARYRPLANACAEVLIEESATDTEIRQTTKRLRQVLSDIQAESLSIHQARNLVHRVHTLES
jgi:hypothetical protein